MRHAHQVTGAIAVGEAAIVLLGALDGRIREAACKERHVDPDTMIELETYCQQHLLHNVLIYPHGYPHRSYLSFLHHYVPELCHVDVSECQVTIVVPIDDPISQSVRDLACTVTGAVCVEEPVEKGPAYKNVPRDLVLELSLIHI